MKKKFLSLDSFGFVEAWVLAHLFVAALALIHVQYSLPIQLILFYGGWRVMEVIVYTVDMAFAGHTKPEAALKVKSPYRSLLLLLFNYFEIVLWFAAFYRYYYLCFEKACILKDPLGALYLSLLTMVGNGDIGPTESIAYLLVISQIGIAIFLTLILFGRFISALPPYQEISKPKHLPLKRRRQPRV